MPRVARSPAAAHASPAPRGHQTHDTHDPPADVLSIADTKRALRKSYETVLKLIEEGHLRTLTLGNRRMVVRASVDELLGNRSPLAQEEETARTVRQAVAAALRRVADDLEGPDAEADAAAGDGAPAALWGGRA